MFTNKEDEIGKKWDKYLNERTGFDNNEYQLAIHELKSGFDQSYAKLDYCVRKVEQKCKDDTLSWFEDFKNKFGLEYINKNFNSIKFVLLAVAMGDNLTLCQEQVKEALYREYRQLDAAQIYVEDFVEFYKTLNKEEKKKLGVRVEAAEAYLRNFVYPLQSVWSNEGLRNSLFSVALKSRKDLDPKVIDFFSHHPAFMRQCLPMKAINLLKDLK